MISEKKARKWMWMGLLAFVALQIYFVQEMLAALMLFTGVFAILATMALALYLIDRAGQWSLDWAGQHARPALQLARRGWAWSKISVKSRSAVHVQSLSSNRAGVVRAEEQGRRGDFICGLSAALQDGFEKAGQLVLRCHTHSFGKCLTQIL